jgi:2'-5' RNA ligase
MRLFTGISLPETLRARVADLLAGLRVAAAVHWSPPENLHITLKFIGHWPDEDVNKLEAALAAVRCPPIEIRIAGFGFFPNARRPRLFYAGVHADDTLAALAKSLDDAAAALGCAPENRPYSPHLTLARIKSNDDVKSLIKRSEVAEDSYIGTFAADRFHLYQSKPGPRGSVYTPLATYPLSSGAAA